MAAGALSSIKMPKVIAKPDDGLLAMLGHSLQTVGMRFAFLICFAVLAAAAPEVQANPDSVPLLCGGSDVDLAGRSSGASPIFGTYQCSEEGVTITLHLIADGRFEQRLVADEPMFERNDGGMGDDASLTGQWRIENGRLHLFAKPTREPQIRLVETNRDAAVALRVEIHTRDGQSPRDIYIGEGDETNPRSALADGVLLVPAQEGVTPGRYWIVRTGDNRRLVSFDITSGGNNVWRFVYEPSELEPFDQRAMVTDDAIVVSLGIAGAVLRRVPDMP